MPVLLTLLVACAPPDPALEVGTGDVAFVPLADGDPIEVIQGPQGGFHVLGSVRATGIERGDPDDLQSPDNPTVSFSVYAGEARMDLGLQTTQALDRSEERRVYELLGRLVILDIASDDALDGVPIVLEAHLEDATGTVLTDARELVAVPSPFNL